MASKFGKRRKPEPRDLFGPPPSPPASGSPASSTPLADYLTRALPGVDDGYVVLPRSLAESMSLPWQQELAGLLSRFHQAHQALSWPVYRVIPSRYEKLVDLDEVQLAEAGYLVEIDADGDMIYRERSGRKVEDPRNTTVLVSCLDPIPPPGAGRTPVQGTPEQPPAAPMIIPPAPVWRSTPAAPSSSVPPLPEPPRKPTGRREQPGQAPGGLPGGDADTPPGGIPLNERGWFDEMTAEASPGEQAQFGPTGEPTEIPYRYQSP